MGIEELTGFFICYMFQRTINFFTYFHIAIRFSY